MALSDQKEEEVKPEEEEINPLNYNVLPWRELLSMQNHKVIDSHSTQIKVIGQVTSDVKSQNDRTYFSLEVSNLPPYFLPLTNCFQSFQVKSPN